MADLSLDLDDDRHRPYFLWDESTTTGELRKSLRTAEGPEWIRLVGKILREARDEDVWRFVTPEEVWHRFDEIRPHLGRRRAFWEYLLRGWHSDGAFVVDFAVDRVPQLRPKVIRDGIPTDTAEEIMANKICALVGRKEIRDLVDLYHLDRAGYHVEDFLAEATRKDAGVSSATIAWLLSDIHVPDRSDSAPWLVPWRRPPASRCDVRHLR